jgi:GNAT superfamily N-acetyltransferase
MPEPLQISPLQEADLEAAFELSSCAGWNQTLEDWRRMLLLGPALAGKIHGRLIATGTLAWHQRAAWVGMILVNQDQRRRGVATRILDELLQIADKLEGLTWLGLDATDSGQPLYEQNGFRAIGHIDRWQLTGSAGFRDEPGVGDFDAETDYEALRELEWEVSGMNRWLIMISFIIEQMLKKGVRIVVARQNGLFAGYGVSRPGRIGPYIGPVVANGVEIATSIVSTLLARLDDKLTPAFIDLPRGNRIANWLESRGFQRVRSWTRMVKGPAGAGRPEMIFASSGPELG